MKLEEIMNFLDTIQAYMRNKHHVNVHIQMIGGSKPTKKNSEEKVTNDFATISCDLLKVKVNCTIAPAIKPIAMTIPASGSIAANLGRSCNSLHPMIASTNKKEYNKK